MSEVELFSFEGGQRKPVLKDSDNYRDANDEEGASESAAGHISSELDGESDSKSESENDNNTKGELVRLCRGGHKRRPITSSSDSDSDSDSEEESTARSMSRSSKSVLRKVRKRSNTTSNTPVDTPKYSSKIPKSAPPKISSKSSTMPKNTSGQSSQPVTKVPRKGANSAHITPNRPVTTKGKSFADQTKEDYQSLSFTILQEISSKLNSVSEQVIRMESRLDAIEKRSSPSSSSDAKCKQKRVIPRSLRVS